MNDPMPHLDVFKPGVRPLEPHELDQLPAPLRGRVWATIQKLQEEKRAEYDLGLRHGRGLYTCRECMEIVDD